MNSILRRNALISCCLAVVLFVAFIGLPFLSDAFGFQFGPIWTFFLVAVLMCVAVVFGLVFASTVRQLWRLINGRSKFP